MGFITGILGTLLPFINKGIDYYMKKADGNVTMAVELMKADQARIAAQRDITVAGMSHPVFWLGWVIFVLPLGIYWGKVLLYDKVLKLGTTDALTGFILEWAGWIVGSLFVVQVGTGIVGSVLRHLAGSK